jgi:hypothetical protein
VHILWLKTELLHPVDKGGRIRTYNMLREIRRRHRVTYLALDDGDAAPDAPSARRSTAPTSCACRSARRPSAARASSPSWPPTCSRRCPYAVAKYRSPAMRREVERLTARSDVDLVVCDFLFPAPNVPAALPCPVVLFQHNVEAMIWRRHTEVAAHPVKRRYMGEQWRRMRASRAPRAGASTAWWRCRRRTAT